MKKLIALIAVIGILSFTTNVRTSPPEKEYYIKGNIQYFNALIEGLRKSELPAKVANQIIDDISSQINKQIISDTSSKKK